MESNLCFTNYHKLEIQGCAVNINETIDAKNTNFKLVVLRNTTNVYSLSMSRCLYNTIIKYLILIIKSPILRIE